jgi:hypothetical protein
MGLFRNISSGLAASFRRQRVEREMDEELRGFLDASIETKKRAGMTPDEAACAAPMRSASASLSVRRAASCSGWCCGSQ